MTLILTHQSGAKVVEDYAEIDMFDILPYYDFYHANEGTDETKGSTLNTTLTDHAIQQIATRTSLHAHEIADILDNGEIVPLGIERGSRRMHILFYSYMDHECFVAVRDTKTMEVVTILPVDFDRHTKVDPEVVAKLIKFHEPAVQLSAPVAVENVIGTAESIYLKVILNKLCGASRFITLKLRIAEFGDDQSALENSPEVVRLLDGLIKNEIDADNEFVGSILFKRGCHGDVVKFNSNIELG